MQTVLIVSDDALAAGRLAHLFARVPCDVALAADGPRARHLMEVLAFDVALVDASRLDAVALVAELRRAAVGAAPTRFVTFTRSPAGALPRLPRGVDAQVTLATSDVELVLTALGASTHDAMPYATPSSPG